MSGLYVAVKYDDKSKSQIKQYLLDVIPNPVKVNDLHTTIIYSNTFDNVKILDWELYFSYIVDYQIWNSDYYGAKILVAILDSDKLKERHEYLMKHHNLTYDYDTYKPHITLSRNIPENFDTSKLPKFSVVGCDEWQEELRPT